MRGAHDLLGVGARAVVAETAAEAIGVALERAGFGADLALAGLAGFFAFTLLAVYLIRRRYEAAMTAPQDFFGGQKIFELFGGLTKSIPAVSYTADNSKASDIMTTAQSEILSGGKDLVATLQDAAKQKVMVDFLHWMLGDAQKMTEALAYAPLPKPVKTMRFWSAMRSW